MATIQSPGIGSGLDVNSIVESLVAAERAPATARMDRKEAELQVKISALGAMKSALSDFRSTFADLKTTSTFNSRSATLSNSDLLEAEAGTAASPGSYEIKVNQLAQSQKLVSAGFESEGAIIGSGELTVTVGDEDYSVEIPEDTRSLADIRDAINSSLKSAGVTASLINVDDGAGGTHTRMTLSSDKTGSDGEITLSATPDPAVGDEPGLQALVDGVEELVAARDAIVEIDGLTVTSSSNKLSNVIEGVTLSLTAADVDKTTTLEVTEDNSSFTAEIKKFVEGYNALQDALASADSYDSEGQTSGALFGDSVLRGFRLSMSTTLSYMNRDATSPYSSLAAMGVTTNEAGRLELDESKLNTALEQGFDDVVDFFTNEDDGFAQRLDDFVYGYSKFDGIVQGRLDGLDARVDDINDQRLQLEERVAKVEARYRSQFQALDQMMSQLTSTSGFLAAQLSNNNNSSNG